MNELFQELLGLPSLSSASFILFIVYFFFGTMLGSLGSVIIHRLGNPTREKLRSALRGRSMCPQCDSYLGPKDLIPIWSYVFLGGKCSHCSAPIPSFYLWLEVLTGLLFALVALFTSSFTLALISRIGILLAISDYREYELNLGAYFLGIFILLVGSTLSETWLLTFISGFVYALVFLVFYFLGRGYFYLKYRQPGEGMGAGDIFCALLFGMAIGHLGLTPRSVFIFVIASCVGSLVLYMLGKKKMSIPFIPGMLVGFIIMLFFGQKLSVLFF